MIILGRKIEKIVNTTLNNCTFSLNEEKLVNNSLLFNIKGVNFQLLCIFAIGSNDYVALLNGNNIYIFEYIYKHSSHCMSLENATDTAIEYFKDNAKTEVLLPQGNIELFCGLVGITSKVAQLIGIEFGVVKENTLFFDEKGFCFTGLEALKCFSGKYLNVENKEHYKSAYNLSDKELIDFILSPYSNSKISYYQKRIYEIKELIGFKSYSLESNLIPIEQFEEYQKISTGYIFGDDEVSCSDWQSGYCGYQKDYIIQFYSKCFSGIEVEIFRFNRKVSVFDVLKIKDVLIAERNLLKDLEDNNWDRLSAL